MAAGLSQEHLAQLARVSMDAISALERGLRRAPQKATLELLIAALALDNDSRTEIQAAAAVARLRGSKATQGEVPHEQFPTNNLPLQLTSFVAREQEVSEIQRRLQLHRLVTVVGTGGAGKTRCAIESVAELADDFVDGVWLVDLAPISDSSQVCAVAARALNLKESPGRPMLDTLVAYLKRKHLLLLLDNCEHVIDEVRRVTVAILYGCPGIRVLATSRESMSVSAEQTYRMPPLPHDGAVRLFSDRAVSADNSFMLTAESTPYVDEICRRLDGIPLAIELAAARVKILSPRGLAEKLDERFRVLTGGNRSALPRHRTMRALIDWSYDLLSGDERAFFRKLSVFAGGFTLEAASAVWREDGDDDVAVLDLLSSLVDKSLVQAEPMEDDVRYRLLESTRQYAQEKLREAGEEDASALAHARAFLRLAKQLARAYEFVTSDRAWLEKTAPEIENFRKALTWAFGPGGNILLGQELATSLVRVWYYFSSAEGRRWTQLASDHVSDDTPEDVLAALDLTEAGLAASDKHYKTSLVAAERALARYRTIGDERKMLTAQGHIGRALLHLGKVAEGEAILDGSVEILRSMGQRRSILFALDTSATARLERGDFIGAQQRYREALAAARALGADRHAAVIAMNLAEAEFQGGDADAALRLTGEALSTLRVYGDVRHVATANYNMAAYLVTLRRYDEARDAARAAIGAARDAQFSIGVAFALQHLAATAVLRPNTNKTGLEDRRRAARVLGYVDAQLAAVETSREYCEQQEYDAMMSALRDALCEDERTKLITEGATWTEDQAVAEAMLF
ncbi:MAG: helix-turn-helix domain-containing protein [Candidatus Eremiobacteraeota bacterium]|nr:helix-turn-helix domain-containing protein [Candidatus Eremiobacteraeota bacterium]